MCVCLCVCVCVCIHVRVYAFLCMCVCVCAHASTYLCKVCVISDAPITVFVLALPAKTIACCFKCGTKCCTLKMCVLTKIAQVNNIRGVAAAFILAFTIHSLTKTVLVILVCI